MKIVLAIAGLLAAFAVGGGFALADGNSSSTPTVEFATTSTGVDISGPCDEAENANDPRCTGAPVPVATGTTTVSTGTTTIENGVDISGPCDEAEHADDPRCTGQPGDDDNSNRGPGGDDEDNSNSGPGGGDQDDDDGDDDNSNSGPGGGGSGSNSGPGGGDDD